MAMNAEQEVLTAPFYHGCSCVLRGSMLPVQDYDMADPEDVDRLYTCCSQAAEDKIIDADCKALPPRAPAPPPPPPPPPDESQCRVVEVGVSPISCHLNVDPSNETMQV